MMTGHDHRTSDPMVERAIRLLETMAGEARGVPVRDVDAYERVFWLADLPEHPAVRIGEGDVVFQVDRAAGDLYHALHRASVLATAHAEDSELVLGIGCLAWKPADHDRVSRHVLTIGAGIDVDECTGRLTVRLTGAEPRLEADLADMVDVDAADIRDRVRDNQAHPLDREVTAGYLRSFASLLDPDAEYHDTDVVPDAIARPIIAWAPALILRERPRDGLADVLATMVRQLRRRGPVPAGLRSLVDGQDRPLPGVPGEGAVAHVDGDAFLPLPVNETQLRILASVDTRAHTLVQGPPGTGKTHTIAVLLTHLLAQGKRVLVTAHTERALRDVRAQLPAELRPLAVDVAERQAATERVRAYDRRDSAARVARCLDSIAQFGRERAELRRRILDTRRAETDTHQRGAYRGTLAAIARDHAADAPAYDWINAYATASLTNAEAREWLALLTDPDIASYASEAAGRLVPVASLLSPEDFAALVETERDITERRNGYPSLSAQLLRSTVAALSRVERGEVQARVRGYVTRTHELSRRPEPWIATCLADIRIGRAETWRDRHRQLRVLIGQCKRLDSLGHITAEGDLPALADQARSVLAYLESGGRLRTQPDGSVRIGAFTNRAVSRARVLFDRVRVNGRPPTSERALADFLAWTEARTALDAIDTAWPELASPGAPASERLQQHRNALAQLDRLVTLDADLRASSAAFTARGVNPPDWTDLAAMNAWADTVDDVDSEDHLNTIAASFAALRASVVEVSRNTKVTAAAELRDAIDTRDTTTYARAHARTVRLHDIRTAIARSDALTTRLDRDLRNAVRADPAAWIDRLSTIEAARDWATVDTWLRSRDNTDANALHARVHDIETRIRNRVEALATARAWRHLAADVPGSLVPFGRIGDLQGIKPDMFDVIIVDEAARIGPDAMLLRYLAPRLVIIGDAATSVLPRSFYTEAQAHAPRLFTLTEQRHCVPEIIDFSNRIAYAPNGISLTPVRPHGTDRLEAAKPVHVPGGQIRGGVNQSEADALVAQLLKCHADPRYDGKTLGVISLAGPEQAALIERELLARIAPQDWADRDLRCGEPADFQGTERDVTFLSMVAAPAPDLVPEHDIPRYNLAASRAREQLWLFHSLTTADLSDPTDLRAQLLEHVYAIQHRPGPIWGPEAPEDIRVEPFASLFEQRVYANIRANGYTVVPGSEVDGDRIGLVVVGARGRLAVVCDGDAWAGPDRHDWTVARQRDLERQGWQFFHIGESEYYFDKEAALARLWDRLRDLGIHPADWSPHTADPAPIVEAIPEDPAAPEAADVTRARTVAVPATARTADAAVTVPVPEADEAQKATQARPATSTEDGYPVFAETLPAVPDIGRPKLIEGLLAIAIVEGPILGRHLKRTYLTASGNRRTGRRIDEALEVAITTAVREGQLIADNPLKERPADAHTYRLATQPTVDIRPRGSRDFGDVPPAELATVMRRAASTLGWQNVNALFRATLEHYDLKKLTAKSRDRLTAVATYASTLDDGEG